MFTFLGRKIVPEPVDPILAAAEARLVELNQELQKVRDFITGWHTFARLAKLDSKNEAGTISPQSSPVLSTGMFADATQIGEAREAESPPDPPARRPRVTNNPKPRVVVQAALELIREQGRPLTRREIRDGLAARGMVVNGADPVKALGTMLWRSGAEKLIQLDGMGYWPVDEPFTAGNYYPGVRTAHLG
jgi:hypothetical protein